MQPQPSLRVVHGSIVWRQHMGGAHRGAKMGGFWGGEVILRPFLHWQCQLGTVPYTVPYSTIQTVKYGHQNTLIRRLFQKNGPYRPNRTVLSDRTYTTLYLNLVV